MESQSTALTDGALSAEKSTDSIWCIIGSDWYNNNPAPDFSM